MIRGISTAGFPYAGPGHYINFTCPMCTKRKGALGSKLRRFQGLKQKICGECAAKEIPAK